MLDKVKLSELVYCFGPSMCISVRLKKRDSERFEFQGYYTPREIEEEYRDETFKVRRFYASNSGDVDLFIYEG